VGAGAPPCGRMDMVVGGFGFFGLHDGGSSRSVTSVYSKPKAKFLGSQCRSCPKYRGYRNDAISNALDQCQTAPPLCLIIDLILFAINFSYALCTCPQPPFGLKSLGQGSEDGNSYGTRKI